MPRAVRHISSIKRAPEEPVFTSIIIPAASPGKRMKHFGARILAPVNGKTLLDKQVSIINNNISNCEIIYIIGFEYEKIIKQHLNRYTNVRFVINPLFDLHNIGYSIYLGILNSCYKNIFLIYGDLYLDKDSVTGIVGNKSKLIFHNTDSDPHAIGAIISQNKVSNLAYGMTPAWSQMAYIIDKEKQILLNSLSSEDIKKILGHEIIQIIINNGGEFVPKILKNKIYELDTLLDYQQII